MHEAHLAKCCRQYTRPSMVPKAKLNLNDSPGAAPSLNLGYEYRNVGADTMADPNRAATAIRSAIFLPLNKTLEMTSEGHDLACRPITGKCNGVASEADNTIRWVKRTAN